MYENMTVEEIVKFIDDPDFSHPKKRPGKRKKRKPRKKRS